MVDNEGRTIRCRVEVDGIHRWVELHHGDEPFESIGCDHCRCFFLSGACHRCGAVLKAAEIVDSQTGKLLELEG